MAPVRRILKTLNTRNYSKNDIEMSYTQIGHEHLETLEDTHILLFHEEQQKAEEIEFNFIKTCLLYTSPSPRDGLLSRMPSSA